MCYSRLNSYYFFTHFIFLPTSSLRHSLTLHPHALKGNALAGRKDQILKLVLRRLTASHDLVDSQLVFVSQSAAQRVRQQVLDQAAGKILLPAFDEYIAQLGPIGKLFAGNQLP